MTPHEQVTALERALHRVYDRAHRNATAQNRRAIETLARELEGATPERLQYLRWNAARTRGLADRLAEEISRATDTATRMISGEALNLFHGGYQDAALNFNRQLRGMGLQTNVNLMNRNTLNAIFNGEHSALARLPGFQEAFRLLSHPMVFDRDRARWYYNRAADRLGNDAELVRRLQNALGEAIALGEGVAKITRRIHSIVNETEHRARRIARTETLRALNQGRYLAGEQAAREYGLRLTKTWRATADDRTRDKHEDADGQAADFEKPFIVGGEELMYPLDPNGSAANTVNCRCTMTVRVKR